MSWRLVFRSGPAAGFLRDTRAGAVGISAVLVTLMCFTGTAMVSDHAVLVHHRNTLQAATVSASIAATQQMAELDRDLTAEETAEALEPLVRRYILANLPEGSRELAKGTLELAIAADRDAGVVGIDAAADLGGAIVGRYLWGRLVERVTAASGAQRVVSPVDLVLAIDVTGSMQGSIYGGTLVTEEHRRINVVRNAAQVLIGALYDQAGGQAGYVSVGLVPFNTTVNIGATRQDWVTDLGQGHKVVPPGFGPWRGCIEHRASQGDLDLSLVTPGEAPFTSWFSPSTLKFRPAQRRALDRQLPEGEGVRGENDWSANSPHEGYRPSPHYACPRDEIVPLTADRRTVEQAIANLGIWGGGGTMTHLGVVWGRRLLASEWRDAWGLLPGERDEPGRKRVLVLLTDGMNDAHDNPRSYPGIYHHGMVSQVQYTSQYTGFGRAGSGRIRNGYRTGTRLEDVSSQSQEHDVLDAILLESCERAKDDGIIVFTVSAVPHGHAEEDELRARLVACATAENYAFVENSEPERMEEAFRQIGRIVAGLRRIRMADSES